MPTLPQNRRVLQSNQPCRGIVKSDNSISSRFNERMRKEETREQIIMHKNDHFLKKIERSLDPMDIIGDDCCRQAKDDFVLALNYAF